MSSLRVVLGSPGSRLGPRPINVRRRSFVSLRLIWSSIRPVRRRDVRIVVVLLFLSRSLIQIPASATTFFRNATCSFRLAFSARTCAFSARSLPSSTSLFASLARRRLHSPSNSRLATMTVESSFCSTAASETTKMTARGEGISKIRSQPPRSLLVAGIRRPAAAKNCTITAGA